MYHTRSERKRWCINVGHLTTNDHCELQIHWRLNIRMRDNLLRLLLKVVVINIINVRYGNIYI